MSMVLDFGVFGEDCEAMAMISEKGMMHRMGSGGRVWNEEGGGAFRFKSTHHAPNTKEWNVSLRQTLDKRMRLNRLGARPAGLGEASWPHLVRCGLQSSGCSSSFLPFLGIWVPWYRKGNKE